jgi:hypothetical protein
VPETHLIRNENLDALAQRKKDFAFKPLHGFAGRGLLASAAVGHARLRRLVNHGEDYVAQRWVTKPCLQIGEKSLRDKPRRGDPSIPAPHRFWSPFRLCRPNFASPKALLSAE